MPCLVIAHGSQCPAGESQAFVRRRQSAQQLVVEKLPVGTLVKSGSLVTEYGNVAAVDDKQGPVCRVGGPPVDRRDDPVTDPFAAAVAHQDPPLAVCGLYNGARPAVPVVEGQDGAVLLDFE